MIIRSAFRRKGELATHLGRTDTNERVQVEVGLIRDAPERTDDALAMFATLSETNPRTRRHFCHVKISPDHPLTDGQLARTLEVIEAEFGISASMPRHVTRHTKGNRADHFHAVYPLIDPDSGRAIKSNGNYLQDELASRQLELEFNERIVPGPRQEAVADALEERGMVTEAARMREQPAPQAGSRIDTAARQQGARTGIDMVVFARTVDEIWQGSGGLQLEFEQSLAAKGIALAMGDKAVMVLDQKTGASASLARSLNAGAKQRGRSTRYKAGYFEREFSGLRPLAEVRDAGLEEQLSKAQTAVERERVLLDREVKLDNEKRARSHSAKLEAERTANQAAFRKSLKARREAIQAMFAERALIRKQRVERAFRVAGLLDNKPMRKLAFTAAALGFLLAGGGLGWALVLGGVAVSALPTRENARRLAYEARGQRQADWDAQRLALKQAYETLKTRIKPEPVATGPGPEDAEQVLARPAVVKPRRHRARTRPRDVGFER